MLVDANRKTPLPKIYYASAKRWLFVPSSWEHANPSYIFFLHYPYWYTVDAEWASQLLLVCVNKTYPWWIFIHYYVKIASCILKNKNSNVLCALKNVACIFIVSWYGARVLVKVTLISWLAVYFGFILEQAQLVIYLICLLFIFHKSRLLQGGCFTPPGFCI